MGICCSRSSEIRTLLVRTHTASSLQRESAGPIQGGEKGSTGSQWVASRKEDECGLRGGGGGE